MPKDEVEKDAGRHHVWPPNMCTQVKLCTCMHTHLQMPCGVDHTCYPSTAEAEAGGLLKVPIQPHLHREILSQTHIPPNTFIFVTRQRILLKKWTTAWLLFVFHCGKELPINEYFIRVSLNCTCWVYQRLLHEASTSPFKKN